MAAPRRVPGKPGRQQKWRELLYAHIRRKAALPEGIGASPPLAWVVGQTLHELALVEQDVIAAVPAGAEEEGNDEEEEPERKRRKKTDVSAEIKAWFMEYHQSQPSGTRHIATGAAPVARSIGRSLDRSTVYRWKFSVQNRRGR